jgi:hypothetical protein
MRLGLPVSMHCRAYYFYMVILFPRITELFRIDLTPELLEIRHDFRTVSRSEMLAVVREFAENDPSFQAEREEDLIDARRAGAALRHEI